MEAGRIGLNSAPCMRFANWMHRRESADPSADVGWDCEGDWLNIKYDNDDNDNMIMVVWSRKKTRWDKKCAIYQQFLYILNLVAVLKEDNICKCLWHPFGYKHDRSCFAWFGLCIATVEYCSDLTHPCDWASPLSVYNLSQLSFLTPGWHRKSQIL